MIKSWATWLVMAALSAALGLSGCGGGGDSSPSASGSASTPAAVTALAITSRNGAGVEQSGSKVTVGDSAQLKVTASGSGTLAYQWYRNGVAIEGATSANYSLAQITGDDDRAAFTVKVSNAANPGGALSGALTLAVYAPAGIDLLAGGLGGSGNADGIGTAARFNGPESLTIDASGNLYLADTFNHTIRKITTDGVVSTLAGSAGQEGSTDGSGSSARFLYPRGLAIDASGNLYVADTGNYTIRKITPAGVVSTLAGSAQAYGSVDGNGSAARFWYPRDLTIDSDGNLYVADIWNHTIRKITPAGVVSTLAGSAGQIGSLDGSGGAARFLAPLGLTIDASGNLYVADGGNSIRKITTDGVVSTMDGSIEHNGNLTIDARGNLYFQVHDTIRKITPAGLVSTLAGSAEQSGNLDGSGGTALFYRPRGLTIDASGNLYVADSGNHAIRKITPAGVVSTLAGSAGQIGSLDGSGSTARFLVPSGMTIDISGKLYVADSDNNIIRKITPAGLVSTLAGSAGQSGSHDGSGSAARFYGPKGLTIDASGNLYVADSYNHTIRKITPAGAVSTLTGNAGQYGSVDGSGSASLFYLPSGLNIDASGNVYVADSYNHTIRKITPAGVVSTLVGSAFEFGSLDGSGSAARFYGPIGLTIDASGNLYVADSGNHTIRKITPTSMVSTLAGSAGQIGSLDGSGSAARFNYPQGLTIDTSGNLYVADTGNHTIRKITPSGEVSTVAGIVGVQGVKLGTLPGGLSRPIGVVYGKRYSGEALYVTTAENNVLTISLR